MTDRPGIVERISVRLGHRPVRWGRLVGDYDGRERTIEIFDADADEQRALLRRLRPLRAELDAAAGGPIVFVFYPRPESRSDHRALAYDVRTRAIAQPRGAGPRSSTQPARTSGKASA